MLGDVFGNQETHIRKIDRQAKIMVRPTSRPLLDNGLLYSVEVKS
jgi:hypothetical protein